jgi:hypothetical protein
MTPREILDRWHARRAELAALNASVDGARLCDEAIRDLEQLVNGSGDEALTLVEAAEESGYTAGHLGREVRAGRIPNAGRENAPKIRRRDLPRKPGFLPTSELETTLSRKRIAQAVANSSNHGVSDG